MNKLLFAIISFCFFSTLVVSKSSAQTSISIGVQQINLLGEDFYGVAYLPSFITLQHSIKNKVGIEAYYYHLNTRSFNAFCTSGYTIYAYEADVIGFNLSKTILDFKFLKTSLLGGVNYRLNTTEKIHGHPDYPDTRWTEWNRDGTGLQIGLRQSVILKNKIELWTTAKYVRYFSGLSQRQLIFDLNVGFPIIN